MKTLSIILLALLCSTASAECARGPSGRVRCGNGSSAIGYNPNTGNAWKKQTNANGVKTYQSSRGGTAKTRNGMGVYRAPSGRTCVKGRYNQGCN